MNGTKYRQVESPKGDGSFKGPTGPVQGNYGENNEGHVTRGTASRHENNDDQDNDDERTERERLRNEQRRGQSPGQTVSKSNKSKEK